jgi:hypothetical protein
MATGELMETLEQLRAREPLFHHRHLVHSAETFDRETREDFWEVGASGRVFTRSAVREVILARCAASPVDEMVIGGWTTKDHSVAALANSTYLYTYLLDEGTRRTRRVSIWQRTPGVGWRVIYHQGTVVQPLHAT